MALGSTNIFLLSGGLSKFLAQLCNNRLKRFNVAQLHVHVEKAGTMSNLTQIAAAILNDSDTEIECKCVGDAGTNAAARGHAANNQCVYSVVAKPGIEWRAKKGRAFVFINDHILFFWPIGSRPLVCIGVVGDTRVVIFWRSQVFRSVYCACPFLQDDLVCRAARNRSAVLNDEMLP